MLTQGVNSPEARTTVTLPDVLEAHQATISRLHGSEMTASDFDASFAAEVPCQASHVHTKCSVEVTHRISWCKSSLLVCENMARAKQTEIDSQIVTCRQCGRRSGECWVVAPWG